MDQFQLAGKRVFIRLDLNVPLSPPDAEGHRQIEDDSRIQESLPTLRYAIDQGARIILGSHLGRPQGKKNKELSLEPVAHRLAELLNQDVTLADDCMGDGIELMVQSLKGGQILLLENLRFYPGEEANDLEFAKRLAKFTDVYINDAFGTTHRKHASTYGLPSLILERGMGQLMTKELQYLEPLLHQPKKPFYAVLGGSKVSDKIKAIENLVRSLDGLLVGGVMGHAFWAAQGDTLPPGAKLPSLEDIDAARAILRDAKRREIPVFAPLDTVDGFDIGPKTIQKFSEVLGHAGTIFWNGPLGWFEKPEYSKGTFEIAQTIAETQAIKIVGGGDTVAAIKKAGLAEQFNHLSTGGGAVLEFLEGKGLPGIDILRLNQRQLQLIQSALKE
jgi:phosphoglycerate kinase